MAGHVEVGGGEPRELQRRMFGANVRPQALSSQLTRRGRAGPGSGRFPSRPPTRRLFSSHVFPGSQKKSTPRYARGVLGVTRVRDVSNRADHQATHRGAGRNRTGE